MRLIDADELLEHIKILGIVINDEDVFTDDIRSIISRLIKAQPTAYDVDAVISELGKASCVARPVGWSAKKEIVELKTAIELVSAPGTAGEKKKNFRLRNISLEWNQKFNKLQKGAGTYPDKRRAGFLSKEWELGKIGQSKRKNIFQKTGARFR